MIEQFIIQQKKRLAAQREAYLKAYSSHSARLNHATQYTLSNSGKQLRALLVFAAGEISKAPIPLLERAAWSLELIHTYSLIHDDLPAMDNANLRRGQASCHQKFCEATAILTGDALLTNAFAWLAESPITNQGDAHKILNAIAHLSKASGSLGMVAGQSLDLFEVPNSIQQLTQVHQLKTGALFEAAVMIGCELGESSLEKKEALQAFVSHLGLAYQIQDDVLDKTSSTESLGKPVHLDDNNDKVTFITLLGLDKARELMSQTFMKAQEALNPLGSDAKLLALLSSLIENRHH